ncbi:MAG TPA: glycosyltransferase family 4 protein [Acidimicrobiia bacterium]|nr:glycosyltransferase family 4 protein [Acidimicrobiia bacterium]
MTEGHDPRIEKGGVLHLLPMDTARGGQVYARALVDALDSPTEPHRILTLFDAPGFVLDADVQLSVPDGWLHRLGFDPRATTRLRGALRRIEPRVVIGHGAETVKYAAFAGLRSTPLVYYMVGSADPRLLRQPRRLLHTVYSRRATHVVAVSSDVAGEAQRRLGIPQEKLEVIPNGRDGAVYRPLPREGDNPRVVFVGHMTAVKRPGLFLDTVDEVRRRGLTFEALMVGDGPLEAALRPKAEMVGVEMLGRREDVPRILGTSDVLVFTSVPENEGMPGVLIEAGLCGAAVLSTRVPGAGDVIEDGTTGIIVDADDQHGLVDALHRLVADRELRERLGGEARRHCLQHFSFDASARLWAGLLQRLPGGGAGSPQ